MVNSVPVATIFTKLKEALFDFASRGTVSCYCTVQHVIETIVYLNKYLVKLPLEITVSLASQTV
jgi:hypothetical protein